MKYYNEEIDKEYFGEVDVQYLEKLHELYDNLPFLPEKMKIEKVENFVTNLHDKTQYIIHQITLNEALNHRLILKNIFRVNKSNQNAWLWGYIDMNTNLRKKIFFKYFLSWRVIHFLGNYGKC